MDSPNSAPRKPLRLWPGVIAVTLQWICWAILPVVNPEWAGAGFLGMAVFGLVVVVWWLLFSRVPWSERLGAIVLIVIGVAVTKHLVHTSIATGHMGYTLVLYSIPVMSLVLVAWAVATRSLPTGSRRAWLAVAILLACGAFTLIRTNGITGDADSDFAWRWTPTREDLLLAQGADLPAAAPQSPSPAEAALPAPAPAVVAAPAEKEKVPATPEPAAPPTTVAEAEAAWPGFRGPERDGVVSGVRIGTDWAQSPPVQIWRRPVGPGWSSFAVRGDVIYTQEQRGDHEVVAAYRLSTGEPVWAHRDAARFWESNAGAGPRATPTISHGRVYTLGGTGLLNALDARSGAVVWRRNAVADTGRKIPDWGISSSPLVVGDAVVVATGGWLVAYDVATGKPRWFGPKTGFGYSSPQRATIAGIDQVVMMNGPGIIGVQPSDGTVLWTHAWPGDSIVQPAVLADGDLLLGSGSGMADHNGMLRLAVAHEAGAWTVKERWTSNGLKPYFNDFVVHDDYAFGFDGSLLACIDLADGTRKWKGGRYGHGQLVVLRDQDLLLVLSEEGDLALVKAAPDQFTEVARFRAIEGKTWNHPVLVGDVVLVRNDQEMAAFRLSPAAAGTASR